ncbi:Pkinase domain-containing protein/LRR_4 domain-containing protein/LRR_7 domain-containing protein/EDR1 domain-containing protein [Cephalotus follicularis]|uniref:Pkinase domain-containing protein/LRR_4 domain-containing protein/LRR_7 domain-containing protein/EDR1 domain-containing protein n=1 Tax=Cephalotus follicularis TaxID=3775 RepID=A0A1Q3APC1_CEPFO|nr:Pkinase domain-containing protein/LRR_4 domain-containing protein/LRR_7 domain-containing protein/EDR1 domain-containing protein [Cephalotus follicularis]
MQPSNSAEAAPEAPKKPEEPDDKSANYDEESVVDISGKSLEFSLEKNTEEAIEGLYVYKNVLNLVPRSVGGLGRLRRLKFFGNQINLFPSELGNLVGLECLQVKVSPPALNGFDLSKLKGLKELELSRVPPRPSVLTILSEIAGLSCLTKLTVCHFSIRYLPPEIGCLSKLEYLDLSFNKIKNLPAEICYLSSLISLKVANNKLAEIPSGLSSLHRLENLDLSKNRLKSLGSLELGLMHNLQNLNLQYNKLLSCCQIPSWISCSFFGNGKDSSNDDFISSSVEMDFHETSIQENDRIISCNGSHQSSSSVVIVSSSNSRSFSAKRSSKRWKRQHYLQQKARQERLNNSRKWKGEGHAELSAGNRKPDIVDIVTSETYPEGASDIGLDDDDKQSISGQTDGENLLISAEDDNSSRGGVSLDNCSSVVLESISKGHEDVICEHDNSLVSMQNGVGKQDEGSSSEILKATFKTKRHCDRDLDNPKPCKSRKQPDDSSYLSHKYSNTSFCGIEDYLPDGFYDAGRDRPFMHLGSYEQILHLDSREVILVDRESDEELDAIALSAQALVFHLKRLNGLTKVTDPVAIDNLQIGSLLALFVSDHFGGSDKSAIVERTRRAVSGSNYGKPFVCTCSTGNSDNTSTKQFLDTVEDIVFSDLCEKSLRSVKTRRNSIIVPIGTLQFGVCRHRALLMKYLCDRMDPPIPCELVRGYLDFSPHAWNIIHVRKGDAWVRMLVDACHPHDIREESDPEYFCRYVPLSRTKVPHATGSSPGPGYSFPSLSECDEFERAASSSVIRCNFGSVDAAAKLRTLEVRGTSIDEIKNFDYSCLGEVRILGALKHPCIVEMFGHQISSKWISSADGTPERRILQSAILMEYVKGGSLKNHITKLLEAGETRVPVELALLIARDVACALVELHSRHIIHRDIKSENILIDLDRKRADGSPLVKLCDFDRAVPLRSFLHRCCIAHVGIPLPDVCVGTPRWMAPEVLRTMHKHDRYGLEVDVWSYGCLLLELLTLQIPYSGLSEVQIHDLLQMCKRPRLTDELEALGSLNEPEMAQSGTDLEGPEVELESLRFLVYLFRRCTEEIPADRPTARDIYEMLLARTSRYHVLKELI